MPTRQLAALPRLQPLKLFLIVLATAFFAEAAVMLLLHVLFPFADNMQSLAVVDSCLLTLILAPLLWWLVVIPLYQVADTRQKILRVALNAQELERRRIARDLHDGLGQSLTCLLVGLRAIEEISTETSVREQASQLRRFGGDAHDEIRRLARGLRPSVLDDAGLLPALEHFLEDITSSQKIETEFICLCDEPHRLPAEVETTLYRIAQEAAANAIRHSATKRLVMTLRCDPGVVELSIVDDGNGFDARAYQSNREANSFGLLSIKERAEFIGGTIDIFSAPGKGTQVTARVPFSIQELKDG